MSGFVIKKLRGTGDSYQLAVRGQLVRFGHVLGRLGAHPPEEVDQVVKELVRVSRRHLFLSISLKGHTKASADKDDEAHRHTMLRPREWWHNIFRKHGAVVAKKCYGPCKRKIFRTWVINSVTAGGKGSKTTEVYTKSATSRTSGWLGRENRKIYEETGASQNANKELEPWFFSFRKIR